jgi:MFS family permease
MEMVNNIRKKINSQFCLSKELYILLFVRVINAIGAVIVPYASLFLKTNKGYSTEYLGFYITILSVLYAPMVLIGGRISDIFSRKKVFIISQIASIVVITAYLIVGDSNILPALLIFVLSIYYFSTPSITFLAIDFTDVDNRKVTFSALFVALSAGIGIWSLVVPYIFEIKETFVFALILTTNIVCVVIMHFGFGNGISAKLEDNQLINIDESNETGILKSLISSKVLIVFSLIMIIYSFNVSQINLSIPIQLKENFDENGTRYFGQLLFINSIVVICATTFINKLTKKLKCTQNMIIAGLLYAIGFGMLYFSSVLLVCIFSTIVWSLGQVIVNSNSSTFIANNSPKEHIATYNSVFTTIGLSGNFVGPAISGMVIEKSGVHCIWIIVFGVSIVASIAMYILHIYIMKKG